MPVTIKDVARIAGVSISTVSRVINDSKPVSSNIQEKVLKVIEDTGYVPNPVARSLVMKKSQLLGVIVPGSSKYQVGELVNAVEEIARMYEYDTILFNTYCDNQKEIDYVNLLRSKQGAGLIMVTENIDEEIDKKLKKVGLPTAYYTLGTPKLENINSVDIDRVEAISQLLEKVENGGKILYLRPDKSENNHKENSKEHLFLKAIKKNKIPSNKYKIVYGANTVEDTYKVLKETFKKEKNIKSIVSANDESTLGSIYYLQDNNKQIPKDCKIVQIYDTQITKLIRPGITAISIPLYDMGAICARMVIKEIELRENKEHKVNEINLNEMILPYKLIERESTKE